LQSCFFMCFLDQFLSWVSSNFLSWWFNYKWKIKWFGHVWLALNSELSFYPIWISLLAIPILLFLLYALCSQFNVLFFWKIKIKQNKIFGFFHRLYYTKVKMGTPPREFYVQIDTGSDVLWVSCGSCNGCPQTSGLQVNLTSLFLIC